MSLRAFTWLLIIIGLGGFAASRAVSRSPYRVSAQSTNISNAMIASTSQPASTTVPTFTNIPSPTTDYKSMAETAQVKANIAEATANEAWRINAQATAEYMALENERLRMTQQVEQQEFQIKMITVTAAHTSIPLTATQQAAVNTQIPAQQALVYAQMTAIADAPTQTVAMSKAKTYEKWGETGYKATIFFQIAVGVTLLIAAVYMIYRLFTLRTHAREEDEEDEELTPILSEMVREDKGNGGYTWHQKNVLPCNPEQLTELAELVVNGERNLAINRLENASRTLRRPTLIRMRDFYLLNELAIEAGRGKIALNKEGVQFHEDWFENHELPEKYKFIEKVEPVEDENPEPVGEVA